MRHCVPNLFLDNNFSASAPSKDNSLCRSWPYPILQGKLSSEACADCWTSNKTRFIVTNQPLGDLPLGMRVEASVRQEVEAKATCFEQLRTASSNNPCFRRSRVATLRAETLLAWLFCKSLQMSSVVVVVRAEIARTLTKPASLETLLLDIFYDVVVREHKFGKLMIALLERFSLQAFRSRVWKIQGWKIFVRLCEDCYVRKPTNRVDHSFNCEIQ